MSEPDKNPTGAALMEFTCRFLTTMLDARLMSADAANAFLLNVERALITGKQTAESTMALAAALDRARSADIG